MAKNSGALHSGGNSKPLRHIPRHIHCDFAVVGSGLAGSSAAYLLSRFGDVVLVAKEPPDASNSHLAQGGIAAAMAMADAPQLHALDTLRAGAGLSDPQAVARLTQRAPELMRWLMEVGVQFDKDPSGKLSLGLEGAHSHPRILHAGGDATGKNTLAALTKALAQIPAVQRVPGRALRLIRTPIGNRVIGVYAVASDRQDERQDVFVFARHAVVLATGGAGQLFAHTTNPSGATGDGIALAYEAGAKVRNLEFVQFHPTALNTEGNPKFLISEAVRGAGARLIDDRGQKVMDGVAPQGDLSPRDVVARRIYELQQAQRQVYLDARQVQDFERRFPTIAQRLQAEGMDASSTPIPVTVAAHFLMGGITTTLTGQTNVPGLYALGEVASSGVHGANRLASNSLLECVAMAHELKDHYKDTTARTHFAAAGAFDRAERFPDSDLPDLDEVKAGAFVPDPPEVLSKVQQIMWSAAGIVRDKTGLSWGLEQIGVLSDAFLRSPALLTSTLILRCALVREESRGAHYRSDFPAQNTLLQGRDTTLTQSAQ